jgi:hypothetical protein
MKKAMDYLRCTQEKKKRKGAIGCPNVIQVAPQKRTGVKAHLAQAVWVQVPLYLTDKALHLLSFARNSSKASQGATWASGFGFFKHDMDHDPCM